MSDEELDEYFVKTLKAILADVKECKAYVSNQKSEEYKEIQEDYDYVEEDLSWIIDNCNSIEELATLADEEESADDADDSETVVKTGEPDKTEDSEENFESDEYEDFNLDLIDRVYNYISSYADNFTVAAEEPEKSENLCELDKIQEILDLFIDDGDFEDEEIN